MTAVTSMGIASYPLKTEGVCGQDRSGLWAGSKGQWVCRHALNPRLCCFCRKSQRGIRDYAASAECLAMESEGKLV